MNEPVAASPQRFPCALRWTARLGGLASLGVMVALGIAERMNPLQMRIEDLLLFLCFPATVMAGLLVGWRWEFAGGALAVGGCTAYFGAHRFLVGVFPKGWTIVACALPGLLFLASGTLARRRTRRAMAAQAGPG